MSIVDKLKEVNDSWVAYNSAKEYNDRLPTIVSHENKKLEELLLERYKTALSEYLQGFRLKSKYPIKIDEQQEFAFGKRKPSKKRKSKKPSKRKPSKRKPSKKRKSKKPSKRKSPKRKPKKVVKDKKGKKIGKRLSARYIFSEHGSEAIGKAFNILQSNGKYKTKYLRLRKNGSPYFSTKFGMNYNRFGS